MNAALKRVAYTWLGRSGTHKLLQWHHRRQALILTYHGVIHSGDNSYSNRNSIAAAAFEQQMDYLARHFQPMSLPELVRRLQAREQLPDYTVVITFDDGFRNNYTVAAPILKKYGLPATIFLATAYVSSPKLGLWTERVDWLLQSATLPVLEFSFGNEVQHLALQTTRDRMIASDRVRDYLKRLPPAEREQAISALQARLGRVREIDRSLEERYAFLTWDQARELQQAQITFGSHTHTHAILSSLSMAEAHFELTESRRLIEAELRTACTLFSYPNGSVRDFSRRDLELVQKLGYAAAVSQLPGYNDRNTDLFALRRINISRSNDFNYFLAKICGLTMLGRP
ncbi:MAG: polysaccharide deacetylase family protein [candidate division KSB1 bacterium]|nr:polysaccharide deacetylase family protein [candidate division KSB1 bacterium]MDZ7272768.1 polysaccharide deacetylase family protein [candidate division KSB1 bacterium]MDZ7284208.1 polysaccharide deacetylase family protein [candidate division KSB1 bacterium]MDZ7297394.1 polysaccharide deacetylase family protein [candidate division KSB1 bacterium]MDZ7306546.1 polysaccharide deacetylase family protein [candidate division KSB1 bacterium]